jgi:hypothetical protein
MRSVGWREGAKRNSSTAQAAPRSRTNERKRPRLASIGMTVGNRCLGKRFGFDEALGTGGETRRGLDEAVDIRSEAGLGGRKADSANKNRDLAGEAADG